METVVFILVFAVLWAWIEIVRSRQSFRVQIADLTQRIFSLEKELRAGAQPRTREPQPVVHTPEPVVQTPPPVPVFAAVATPPPAPVPAFVPPVAPPPPPRPVVAPPLPPPPPPQPAPPKTSQDWEALVGGNLLNKIGALLLVIGIMSFLAYYGTRMGPAGRAACALAVSFAILATGIWMERLETYRIIARSLIGGGWAALYATAYAIYALPAARIIDNPFLGSMLVLLVAAGMIAPSPSSPPSPRSASPPTRHSPCSP
jgi:uncharacterized membrane protein